MRFFRAERVSKLIRRELSKIIEREVEFHSALVTIMEVEVDKKLERAKVGVSVIPSSAGDAALAELEKRAGALQHLLMEKVNIKPMPRIVFALDRGPENVARVEKLLEDAGANEAGAAE
jgi:ribosome-binding factor A